MSSRSGDERGSVSAFAVCLVGALVLLGCWVVDSGRYVETYMEMSDAAENAARIGAQSVVGIRAGNPHVDRSLAVARARNYLSSVGMDGSVRADGRRVTVSVSADFCFRTVPLPGIGQRRITVARSATSVDG